MTIPDTVAFVGDYQMAWRVLRVLDAVEWKWSIQDVLNAPEALLDDVLKLRALAAMFDASYADEQTRAGKLNAD